MRRSLLRPTRYPDRRAPVAPPQHDVNGNVTAIEHDAPDGAMVTLHSFDANDRPVRTVHANGSISETSYDGYGRQWKQREFVDACDPAACAGGVPWARAERRGMGRFFSVSPGRPHGPRLSSSPAASLASGNSAIRRQGFSQGRIMRRGESVWSAFRLKLKRGDLAGTTTISVREGQVATGEVRLAR